MMPTRAWPMPSTAKTMAKKSIKRLTSVRELSSVSAASYDPTRVIPSAARDLGSCAAIDPSLRSG